MTIEGLKRIIEEMRETHPFNDDACITVESHEDGDIVKVWAQDFERDTMVQLTKFLTWRKENI